MLDFQLAELYEEETRALKQAVRRNFDRFPEDFMFELTSDEVSYLGSQFVIPSSHGGSRYGHFAFTEQGFHTIPNSKPARKLGTTRKKAN